MFVSAGLSRIEQMTSAFDISLPEQRGELGSEPPLISQRKKRVLLAESPTDQTASLALVICLGAPTLGGAPK
jgi:hypothetical protein